MIGKLTGTPEQLGNDILIDVSGVGYLVHVSSSVLGSAQNEQLTLFIYTHVKEEALELYGFPTLQEKELFMTLLSVSGVGPSIALNISNQRAEKIVEAVQNAQVSFFTAVPRVGKKLAQKIIIDLKSKLGSLKELQLGPASPEQELIASGLTNLGFDETAVLDYVKDIDVINTPPEEAIKQGIKALGNQRG